MPLCNSVISFHKILVACNTFDPKRTKYKWNSSIILSEAFLIWSILYWKFFSIDTKGFLYNFDQVDTLNHLLSQEFPEYLLQIILL